MTTARDDILGTIRRSLGVSGRERPRSQVVDDRLRSAPTGLVPARGQAPTTLERVAVFRREAEAAFATVTEVEGPADVPRVVAQFLRDHNLPATLRMGEDPRLSAMPWAQTALDIARGPSMGADLNAVSHALGGVAETGTLVMVSGPENPSTLNFLPDNHIVVVRAADVAGDYEAVLQRVRDAFGKGAMPRTVNFITGPSRSADVEQTLLLGAHGPRRLHIVVVNGRRSSAEFGNQSA